MRDALAAQELMTSSITDIRGDDVTPDYNRGIAHVRLTLDELRERKLRTDELCDVRRIKLQQLLQLKQSERDAEQVEIREHKFSLNSQLQINENWQISRNKILTALHSVTNNTTGNPFSVAFN